MNAEFNWWLLILGLAAGAGLAWLVLSDLSRREDELSELERSDEAGWIGEALAAQGRPTSPETIERVLALHRSYVELPAAFVDEDQTRGPALPADSPRSTEADRPAAGPR